MINTLASAARQAYWRLANRAKPGRKSTYPADYSSAEFETIEAVEGKTLTTRERIVALVRAIEYMVRYRIAGDVVECGVYKGGSMMAAALTLQRLRAADRAIYLYDT